MQAGGVRAIRDADLGTVVKEVFDNSGLRDAAVGRGEHAELAASLEVVMDVGAQLAIAVPEKEGAYEVNAVGGRDFLLEGEPEAPLALSVDVEAGFSEREVGADWSSRAICRRDGEENLGEDAVPGERDELGEGPGQPLDEVVGDGDLGCWAFFLGDGVEGAGKKVGEMSGEGASGFGFSERLAALPAGGSCQEGLDALGEEQLV